MNDNTPFWDYLPWLIISFLVGMAFLAILLNYGIVTQPQPTPTATHCYSANTGECQPPPYGEWTSPAPQMFTNTEGFTTTTPAPQVKTCTFSEAIDYTKPNAEDVLHCTLQ